jgi:polar amino acid transport system substrate-binding protein
MVKDSHGLACRRVAVACSIAVALSAQALQPIRLATHEQAPYGSTLPDKTFDGVAVRVVSCVLKRMGRDMRIEVYPWERAQMLAERQEVDGFFPATLKPERLAWAEATAIIADQKWVWYLRAGSPLNPNAPDFKASAKVGAHFGSNRLKTLEAEQYQVVLRPQTDAALLKAFLAGRADAILGGDLAIAQAMKEQNVNPASFKTYVAQNNPLHAYFGRKFLQSEPDFVKRFNAQIGACR